MVFPTRHYLEEIGLTRNLYKINQGTSILQKPSKIYLENTNLIYLLACENSNIGNVRETFFANQLVNHYKINYTHQGDFLIDEKYTFEIGGKDKTNKQIKNVANSYIAADNLE